MQLGYATIYLRSYNMLSNYPLNAIYIQGITLMSHEGHWVSNHRQLDCLSKSASKQTMETHCSALPWVPLSSDSPQWVNNAEDVSMSWRRDQKIDRFSHMYLRFKNSKNFASVTCWCNFASCGSYIKCLNKISPKLATCISYPYTTITDMYNALESH